MVQLQDDQRGARTSQLAGELRVLIGQLKRRMQDRGNLGDLRPSQIAILVRLERSGPATVSQLARAEGMRPQSMGANVATLEAAGLLVGKLDPTDGRQSLLSLTSKCRELISAGRLAREDWLFGAINKTLSPDEQDELGRAISLLKRIAES